MTDIDRLKQAIDDPFLTFQALADAFEERGKDVIAAGLRKLAEGRGWPSKGVGRGGTWSWRVSYRHGPTSRAQMFSPSSYSGLLPRLGDWSDCCDVWQRFTSASDALSAAAVSVGKYLKGLR